MLLFCALLEKREKRGVGGPELDNETDGNSLVVGSGCFVFLRRKPAIAGVYVHYVNSQWVALRWLSMRNGYRAGCGDAVKRLSTAKAMSGTDEELIGFREVHSSRVARLLSNWDPRNVFTGPRPRSLIPNALISNLMKSRALQAGNGPLRIAVCV